MDIGTLYTLQQLPQGEITAFLAARHWQQEGHRMFGDLHIERWTQAGDRLTVEFGPDYDTSVIYQTRDAESYRAILQAADVEALLRHVHQQTASASYTAYRDDEDILIVGEPLPGVDAPYTVIVTTTLNIDALWLESEYVL